MLASGSLTGNRAYPGFCQERTVEKMKITGSMNRHYENMGDKQLTLAEKWKIDVEAYKKGAVNKTSAPQCIKCRYVKKGDALHCNVYKEERKPRYVMFPHKECPSFCSNDILEVDVPDMKCDKRCDP